LRERKTPRREKSEREREREGGRESVGATARARVRARVRRGAAWDGELERDRTNVPAAHASNPEVA